MAGMRTKERNRGGRVETYTVSWIDTVETYLAHGENDRLCAIEGVSVNGGSVGHKFFVCETVLVYNPHLSDDGRFPRPAQS